MQLSLKELAVGVSDGGPVHLGFQTGAPSTLDWVLLPAPKPREKEFPVSSVEIGDFPFHLDGKYWDYFSSSCG